MYFITRYGHNLVTRTATIAIAIGNNKMWKLKRYKLSWAKQKAEQSAQIVFEKRKREKNLIHVSMLSILSGWAYMALYTYTHVCVLYKHVNIILRHG